MDQLWAPWRMEFIKGDKPPGCIFCQKPNENQDEKNFILRLGRTSMVMMNIYPYNHAHLLASPFKHVNGVDLLDKESASDLMESVRISVSVLKEAFRPDGFNIGINMGKFAGAGIEDHVHIHIVPRWSGDTNFMPLLAEVRVMPEHLVTTYRKLLPLFQKRGES
jgi:ATP adenylyltransferase